MPNHRLTGHLTGRRTLALLAIWLCFQGVFAWLGGRLNEGGAQGPPDLLLFASPDALRVCIDALGEAGRALYLRTFYVDMVYPAVYSLLFASIFVLAGRRLGVEEAAGRLAALFFVGAAADWAENVCFLAIMRGWPEALAALFQAGAVFNHIKWGSLVLAIFLGVPALLVVLARRAAPR